MTDTSSFMNSNTTPKALTVAAQLVAAGADQQQIVRVVFNTNSLPTLRIWGRALSYIKDLRDVYRRQGVYYSLPLYDEIARRLKLTRIQVSYLLSAEIASCLKKGKSISISEIKKRQKGFLAYFKNNKVTVSTDKKLIAKFKKYVVEDDSDKKVIKGITACGGRAKGIVRLVKTVKDLDKIKKGDILVAITTHPDFVPAMQKAGAIVTDEGGLTSHAAIVAREMNKPCLVGCKSAVRTLRDGDEVEVDATKGEVKILTK